MKTAAKNTARPVVALNARTVWCRTFGCEALTIGFEHRVVKGSLVSFQGRTYKIDCMSTINSADKNALYYVKRVKSV